MTDRRRPLSADEESTILRMCSEGAKLGAVRAAVSRGYETIRRCAAAHGLTFNKPKTTLASETVNAILERLRAGASQIGVARELGISPCRVHRLARENGVAPSPGSPARRRKRPPVDPRVARERRLKKMRAEHAAWKKSMGILPPAKAQATRPTSAFSHPVPKRTDREIQTITREARNYSRDYAERDRAFQAITEEKRKTWVPPPMGTAP